MFCGYCGKENSDNYRFCVTCGKPLETSKPNKTIQPKEELQPKEEFQPLKEVSRVNDGREHGKAEAEHKPVSWESISLVVVIFVSMLCWVEQIKARGPGGPNLGTITQIFAGSIGVTIIPWIVVLKLTKSFRKRINQGTFFLAGFIAMASSYFGPLVMFLLEGPSSTPNPLERIYWAVLISPIWFVIGFFGNFLSKNKLVQKP